MRSFVAWATSKRGVSIILLNAILAIVIPTGAVLLWQGTLAIQTCFRSHCPPYFTSARLPKKFSTTPRYVLSRHSGYSLSNNHTDKLFAVDFDGRNKVKNLFLVPPLFTYSTDGLGFRKHRPNSVENHELTTKASILALGDSFTFGDEVDDLATWPAYLERTSSKTVHNAGVGWFGSAQAVTHGHAISQTMNVDTVILSVLVDEDIKRDRWVGHGRHGQFRRRPVVDRSGVLMHLPAYAGKVRRSDITHAEAINESSIINYVLQRLLRIPASQRVLLLQYPPHLQDSSKEALEERALWFKKAKAWNIPIVDTFDVLRKAKDSHHHPWIGNVFTPPRHYGHHTSYGNEIVAQAILDSGVLD